MDPHLTAKNLQEAHTAKAIAARLASSTTHSYLGDFVLGAIDGTITTFAMVAGAAGAGYSSTVALVLGVANLLADGFSMAVGNYLSTKAERQIVQQVRQVEHQHIEKVPEGEREEIRQIFASKGFEGELLEQVVDVITEDRHRWVDTMVTEEFGLPLDSPSPLRAGLVTYLAFAAAGFVPLTPLFFAGTEAQSAFAISTVAAGVTFFLIGLGKGRVLKGAAWLSGLETLFVGGMAACLAYGVGSLLQRIVGG